MNPTLALSSRSVWLLEGELELASESSQGYSGSSLSIEQLHDGSTPCLTRLSWLLPLYSQLHLRLWAVVLTPPPSTFLVYIIKGFWATSLLLLWPTITKPTHIQTQKSRSTWLPHLNWYSHERNQGTEQNTWFTWTKARCHQDSEWRGPNVTCQRKKAEQAILSAIKMREGWLSFKEALTNETKKLVSFCRILVW